MARAETEYIQLKLQATQPGIIVDQALNAIRLKANQKNLVVNINMAGFLSLIQADVEKTSRVLINFLTNAIKYTPGNSEIAVNVSQKDKLVDLPSGIQVMGLMKSTCLKYLTGITKYPARMSVAEPVWD